MKAVCPKCGWETRELDEDEADMVRQGRYRCSGACQEASVANQPNTFPPRLKLPELEPAEEHKRRK